MFNYNRAHSNNRSGTSCPFPDPNGLYDDFLRADGSYEPLAEVSPAAYFLKKASLMRASFPRVAQPSISTAYVLYSKMTLAIF